MLNVFFTRRMVLPAIITIIALLCFSCGSSQKLAEGEYALSKNVIHLNTKKINPDNLALFIKQKPSAFRFFKKKKLVVFDESLIDASKVNIEERVRQLGYYTSRVSDTVIYKGNKATVVYDVNVDDPLVIGKLVYDIPDSTIRDFVFADSINTKIKAGKVLSIETLEEERTRISNNLRNEGYYDFNKTFVKFKADSTQSTSEVLLKMIISDPYYISKEGSKQYTKHKKYKIKTVYVLKEGDEIDDVASVATDAISQNDIIIVNKENQDIKKALFKDLVLLKPNDFYNAQNERQTYNNLSNLNFFRTLRIEFTKEMEDTINDVSNLICYITLTPLTVHGYNFGFELSTNSAGLWGVSPSLGYVHRNLFKGAERFEFNISSMHQFRIVNEESKGYKKSNEVGFNTSLDFPKFLMPIRLNYFKKNIPHTKLSANYLYQKRRIYTRTTAGGSFGYEWQTSDYMRYAFNPINLKLVKLDKIDSDFFEKIKQDPYVRSLYENHFSLGLSASFIHTNQLETYRRNTHFFRLNFELAGNLMSLFNPLMKKDEYGKRLVMETRYSQYARIDASYTRNKFINKSNKFVYRLFAGVGKAYGNSLSMPFDKMYYSGGANSLRGWSVRSVGPGSAERDTSYVVPNQVADFKLEFNAEWRFKIAWGTLEGALFVDAGNVWTLNKYNTLEGARFKFNTFFNTIAANTGVGLRLNLGICTFRLDLGVKIHDPALKEHRFVKVEDWLRKGNKALHFGLNYPF